jgi:hypothetical protein
MDEMLRREFLDVLTGLSADTFEIEPLEGFRQMPQYEPFVRAGLTFHIYNVISEDLEAPLLFQWFPSLGKGFVSAGAPSLAVWWYGETPKECLKSLLGRFSASDRPTDLNELDAILQPEA